MGLLSILVVTFPVLFLVIFVDNGECCNSNLIGAAAPLGPTTSKEAGKNGKSDKGESGKKPKNGNQKPPKRKMTKPPNGYSHCVVDKPDNGPGRHLESIINDEDGRTFTNQPTFQECVVSCYWVKECVGCNYDIKRKRCFLKKKILPKTTLTDSGWNSCVMVVLDESGNVIEIPDSYTPTDEEEIRLQLFGTGEVERSKKLATKNSFVHSITPGGVGDIQITEFTATQDEEFSFSELSTN